jgi:hypothetical protein
MKRAVLRQVFGRYALFDFGADRAGEWASGNSTTRIAMPKRAAALHHKFIVRRKRIDRYA